MILERESESASTAAPMAFRLGYRPCLDGLRGVSILTVVGVHALLPDIRAEWTMAPFIGVDIFFVLSGFLITCLLLEEWEGSNRISLKGFYIRRALRLLPALVTMLIAMVVFSWVVQSKAVGISTCVDALFALFYSSNWARAFGFHRTYLFAHTWSLSIEEQFYLLGPVLLILLLKCTRSRASALNWIIFGVSLSVLERVVLVTAGASADRIVNGTDTRADSLLLGCALAAGLGSGLSPSGLWAKRLVKYSAWVAVVGLVALGFNNRCNFSFAQYVLYFVVSFFAGIIILEVVTSGSGLLNRLLSQRWLVYVGQISYGLYLWHVPVFRIIHGYGWARETELTVELLVAFGATLMSFYVIERPALRLKRSFRRLQSEPKMSPLVPVAGMVARAR